ncbi:MAG: tRNA (N(6)-L-threonylcarbamoyladenosine(37)-C(2))-methylthiotransferase MtaB [Rhodobacter sp.]|nr:tRNA (N(6)-L-threonylcarbamoyladenosine(37)-C(2))-methylthiotransferase MtaB [Rhodobacter sp.]MCY4240966.1 tRNA (N(6)-L-threonylcarbamoyladenosine(37)-C(2))-methylthiotransferase MtaB [Rhodobacter sp.]
MPTRFATLGCRLNACETEAMRSLAARHGVEDAVVVNTCAVTSEAVRKARKEIRRLRRADSRVKVIVTGCAAQVDAEGFAAMEEVDLVIGNAEKVEPGTWEGIASGRTEEAGRIQVGDIMDVARAERHATDGVSSRSRAYVQIQNGCDHRCTFCVIPFGRGNSRSVPADVVIERIRRLVSAGHREVVLTGVDLTAWGNDLSVRPRLGDLVWRILDSLPELPRLRLSSIDSIEVDGRLMRAFAEQPRLMPHLHLSLQAGDDLILRRMKRRHGYADAVRFCEEIRHLRPEMTFGADIIVGFPTENEAMFGNSLRMVSECGLTWLHVFPFSARPGTPAARMPQVDGCVIRERSARLRKAGKMAAEKHLKAQVGRVHRVLMESPTVGRTEQFAQVEVSTPRLKGTIARVRIAGVSGNRLTA